MAGDPSDNLTSLSLLDRLRQTSQDGAAWRRLHDVYTPLIRGWLRRVPGLAQEEKGDLVQEVFVVLLGELPHFQRQRVGSFRAWLRGITVNRIRTFWKERQRRPRAGLADETESFLTSLADPASALAQQWDRDHDQHVLERLLALVQNDFEPKTWAAFQQFALAGKPAAQVAEQLGLSENAVLLAKSRVLRRLREESKDLLD